MTGTSGARRHLATVLLLGVALASIGATVEAPASAAPTDPDSPYVGVLYPQLPNATRPWENDPAGNRKLLSRAYDAGMRWTYIWVAWSDIETDEGVWDQARLAKLDEYLTIAREEGIHVVVQLMVGAWGYPQPWAPPTRRNSQKPPPNLAPGEPADTSGPATPAPEDLVVATAWMQLLVRRYMPGGELAQERGWTDGYGITTWELENEPDSLAWYGDWSKIPKDYAEYVATVEPVIHAADPEAIVKAPALSHRDGERLSGLPWLEEVLSAGDAESEWASDTYRASGGHPGAGAFIDAFSFHRNNPTLHDKQAAQRAVDLRALVESFSGDAVSPTRPDVEYHYSEGSALQYTDPLEFSWAQTQLMASLLGVGVDKMVFSPAAEINKDPWDEQPIFKAMRAVSTHLPRAGEVVAADQLVDPDRVTTYVRTDPDTGLRTWVLWAHTLPPDSETGASFEVDVPVRTRTARVIDADWTQREVDGPVTVTLTPADPSPTVMIIETGALPAAGDREQEPAGDDAGARSASPDPSRGELPATGAGTALVGLLAALGGLHRRRAE